MPRVPWHRSYVASRNPTHAVGARIAPRVRLYIEGDVRAYRELFMLALPRRDVLLLNEAVISHSAYFADDKVIQRR